MKNLLILLVVAVIGGLLWRQGQQAAAPSPLDVAFEANHDDEMANKDNTASELVGQVTATMEVLQPEQEVDIVTETVEYTPGTNGFLAYPQDNPEAPGVIVIHERWGLNEHIEDMARVLAMNGYRALAVDLYKGQVAEDREQAGELTSSVNAEEAVANLLDAEAYLRTTSPAVASLGRCFGGKQSLDLSIASETLDATVIYYGRLTDDTEVLSQVNQPLLGIFAENDSGIPPSSVAAFQAGLDQVGKTDYDITIFSGVDHAFANPTGGNFSPAETLEAWEKTLAFLAEHL